MKYLIILFICLSFSISVQCKAVYKLRLTRADVVRYVKGYVEGRMWITKPDRYTNALNGEFILYNIPQDATAKIKMYEFLNNEYRPFAFNLKRDLCHFVELEYKMMFYPDLLKIGAHMPEPRCPIKPRNYSFANLIPDVDNYPAALPFHNFMLECGYWHGTVELVLIQIYGTFDRDAVIREQYSWSL